MQTFGRSVLSKDFRVGLVTKNRIRKTTKVNQVSDT